MLTQDDLLLKLERLGEKATAQTLRNREKNGLTGPAYRGGAGRPGRSVFYPDRVLWENYAASKMLNSPKMRLNAKEVAAARSLALQIEANPCEAIKPFLDKPEADQLGLRFAEIWHSLVVYAWLDCPPSIVCDVFFYDNATRHSYTFVKNADNPNGDRRFVSVNPATQKFMLQEGEIKWGDWLDKENVICFDALF